MMGNDGVTNSLSGLLVISGPSGVGKSTVCSHILNSIHGSVFSVSYTTRAQRTGEVNGVDYHFLSHQQFEERIAAGDFLEHALVHGNYYGTSIHQVDERLEQRQLVLLDIDVQGGLAVKKHYPESFLVFLIPPDIISLYHRLKNRGTDDEATILRRIDRACDEINQSVNYDMIIENRWLDSVKIHLLETLQRCFYAGC